MKFIGEHWRWGWTSCPGCGSFQIRTSLLCEYCENYLMDKAHASQSFERDFLRRHIFDWNPGESDLLSNLILSLKGPGAENAWRFWAEMFVEIHGAALPDPENIVLIAAPSHSDGEDHSSLFASALAERLGCVSLGRGLKKTAENHHRSMNRSERERRHDLVKVTGFEVPAQRRIVFVDDVSTTGSTASAIQHALGKPRAFEVWTLAVRTLSSCGAQAPMVGNLFF